MKTGPATGGAKRGGWAAWPNRRGIQDVIVGPGVMLRRQRPAAAEGSLLTEGGDELTTEGGDTIVEES